MELTWINLADTAIKIGLGALITGISGYLVIRKNHDFETYKIKTELAVKNVEDKKLKFIEFLAQSQSLVQNYMYETYDPKGDDFKSFLRVYNEIQVVSSSMVRHAAYELHIAVYEFIQRNKNHDGTETEIAVLKELKDNVNNKLGIFQGIVNQQITEAYEKI